MKCLFSTVMLAMAGSLIWSSAVRAEIRVPASVPAGSPFEAVWTGSEEKGKISVLAEDGGQLNGASYSYLKNKKVTLTAPGKPGAYAVGFQKDGSYTALEKFTVTPVTATLTAPSAAGINSKIDVQWTGPAYKSDVISITEKGSEKRGTSYTYPAISKDGTVTLKVPLKAGDYEIIYQMGTETLARTGLRVGGTAASLEAAESVQAGGDVEIRWEGPDNSGDTISITKPGAATRGEIYTYTRNSTGSSVLLTAPEALEKYEIAYFTGGKALARRPLEVVAVSATLDAPEEVVATLSFEIAWTGPGNRQDSIVLSAKGTAPEVNRAARVFVVKDETLAKMKAPEKAGDYELHYLTGKGKVLATRALRVTPAPQNPGFLRVTGNADTAFGKNSAVEIILDASGSMLKRQGAKRRIEIAKETLQGLLTDTIPDGTGFALRVFGHKEADSCRTDLEIPLAPLDSSFARQKIAGINAMNLAKTPIAASLEKVASDLSGVAGERIVILLTDGEETCDGDPALAIRLLRSEGTDVRVNIVGYSIDDEALQETFESWATVGGGQYLNAPDAEELAKALRRALAIPFEVYAGDVLTAEGISGGRRIELPAGTYQVRYRQDGKSMTKDIEISPDAVLEVAIP